MSLAQFGELLEDAEKALGGLPLAGLVGSPRVLWLQRQLANLIKRLQSLIADLEGGCSLSEIGFFGAEGQEEISDLSVEISTLKGMMQTARMIER